MTVASKHQTLNVKQQDALEKIFENHWGFNRKVEIYRESDECLGISIVCGKVDLHTLHASLGTTSGIFIKSIVPSSAAAKTGQLQIGDRILKVGDIDLEKADQEEALTAIRGAGDPISLIVQSLLPLNKEYGSSELLPTETESVTEAQTEVTAPAEKAETVIETKDGECFRGERIKSGESEEEEENKDDQETDDDEDDDDDDDLDYTRQPTGKIITKQGQEIDCASAGNLKMPQDAANLEQEDEFGYTINKIKTKYAHFGNTVMMVQMERGRQGLGLSLAGHKDRNCMAVFVCGLNPKSAAIKIGGMQIGDEILEVNGIVLHGRCHLNASAIIKGLSGPIFKFVILRRKSAVNDIAVQPVTHFPALIEEGITEDQLSHYPNVRHVKIKKESHSLGIMIIEGRHAILGQGIFISDIQIGSAADKVGLEVGEMILAVNSDLLLGANYDMAASLLKRTEGLVTLVLSNPNKKEIETNGKGPEAASSAVPTEQGKQTTALKTSVPPSRAATPLPEPVLDPTTCSVVPGKQTTIEIMTDNRSLGIFFAGGKDTLMPEGIVVIEVFAGGAADKDGRIKAGDQILEANGTCFKETTNETVLQTLRQIVPKMKLIIFRPEKIEYSSVEVDLMKKPGKGLGLSVIAKKSGEGVYISEILNGSNADIDGRIAKGDLLVSVNDQKTDNLDGEKVGAILKTIVGRVILKFYRYKPLAR